MLARIAVAVTVAAGAIGTVSTAHAQTPAFPSKPLRFVVPFVPGSATDSAARIVAQGLGEELGVTVLVENKPGANGILGAEIAKAAVGDPHTLLVTTTTTQAANPSLYKQLPYDPIKDFAPIGRLANTPALLVVNPAVPARNLAELIALARSKPGKLSYASGSAGTLVPGAMLTFAANLDMVHVPYKSIPDGLKDVMGGQVDMMFTDMATGATQVKAGRVRALGISSLKPSPLMPEVPPIANELKDFELLAWYAMFAPTGTPQSVIDRLSREIQKAIAKPAVRERLAALGLEPMTSTPAELAEFNRTELEKWGRVIRRTGATPQ